MFFSKYSGFTIFLVLFISLLTYGQNELVLNPYDGTAGSFLTAQIIADTTANNGIPANRVYLLQRGGVYLDNETFYVPQGSTLRLEATGTGKMPIIFLYPTGTGSNPQNAPTMFFTNASTLMMKGLFIDSYFEPVDSNWNNMAGTILRTSSAGSSFYVDSCIIDNASAQVLRTDQSTITVKITNTIFSNLGNLHQTNFGAGKGLDLRESSCDSLILVNNTFVNYLDRVVRHYNYSNPLAGTGGIGYCLIDHNTFINGCSYHGLINLGNMGGRGIITNNLFVDAFALGEDSADYTRQVEWGNVGEKYPNGYNRMSWIFDAPNDTTVWTISNNYYSISDSGQAFLNDFKLTENTPLTWHLNKVIGADSATAFMKENITLANAPMLQTNLMRWYRSPNGGNLTKNTPNDSLWHRATDDLDRHTYHYWLDSVDCSYPTSVGAYTGAMGGYPAGSLVWFPAKYAEWVANPTAVKKYNSSAVVKSYQLNQNYPNPFNPSTVISYALPKSSQVSLIIYNALGQEVARLVNNENQASGKYDYQWNAKDSFGRSLSSGIYFYQLRTNNMTLTKKMMLLK